MPPRLRDSPDDLEALLGTVAEAVQRPVSFLEKDFWAMEVLRVASVDRQIELEDGIGVVQTVFKGGTSLSRVYGLIDRFSEDIDLLVSFPDDGGGPGVNRRDRLLKSIQAEVHAHLGQETVSVERLTSKTGVARKIKYHYPLRTAVHNALAEGVILEMGSRGGLEPMERRPLRSIIADYAISQLRDSEEQWEEFTPFEVNVLGAERTLLEKLSAVHSITSNLGSKEPPAGWGRHFHDIYYLLQSEDVRAKLVAMGADEVKSLVIDIEERSVAGGFENYVPRPVDGYAASPAFDSGAPVAAEICEAYEAVAGLMYGPVVPLEECLATVHAFADLI